MSALAETIAVWPLAASMALGLAAVGGWRASRRRSALNRALHELRRPLQAIAMAGGPEGPPAGVEGSLRLAAAALERLDREVNGSSPRLQPEPVEMRVLLESAARRWESRARCRGGSLQVRWRAEPRAAVLGDRAGLAQAVDNLIVNALEHGGPRVSVEARHGAGRLRILVADSGRHGSPGPGRPPRERRLARLAGRNRHGHGLAVVREVAAAHGGRFSLRRSAVGTVAVLDLPLHVSGLVTGVAA